MARYELTKKAVEDLSEIWNYTFELWSEKQADQYYGMLILSCQEIADNPGIGNSYDGIARSLLGLKTNRHIIFYRTINENEVEITRILHERMDLRKRMLE